MKVINKLKLNLKASIAAKNKLLDDLLVLEKFSKAVEIVVMSYLSGGRIYIAGNGGSAADAQHLAAEFVSKLARDRAPLPAEALTVDSSVLTAIANDYGYEEVFARQLYGKVTKNDIFLGISTSGQSKNIIRALEACRELAIPSIVFCGKDGGLVNKLADHVILVPGETTSTIQELHIVLGHTLCECVETAVFGD